MTTEETKQDLRSKVITRVLASPVTYIPFLGGITMLIGSWATGVRPDIGLFAGVVGALGSAGVFLTKLLIGGESIAREVIEEERRDEAEDHERALDDLDRRLREDDDPRTEAALHDLRMLAKAFRELREGTAMQLDAVSVSGIASGVEELFNQCVNALEQSLKLWHTADSVMTEEARAPILKQREQLLRDVTNSIKQLGHIVAAVQNAGAGDGDGVTPGLARIGKELDQHLAVARQVEQRMRAFEAQLDSGQRE